jgi:hypothetical protein
MRVKKLIIKNIGKLEDISLLLDKPLLLFYGEIRQGKTTILNAVRWVCGGEFPDDIIRHGQAEAFVELELEDGVITRSWYRAKDEKKTVTARPVKFIRNGKPVPSPVSEIKRFLNPFLLNQDHLRNKNELERKQFFAELFAADTTALDAEWVKNDREATSLRSKIKGYGDIDLTEHKRVDVADVQSKLTALRAEHAAAVAQVTADNTKVTEHNSTFDRGAEKLLDLNKTVEDLKKRLSEAEAEQGKINQWLLDHPKKTANPIPNPPADIPKLEQVIQDAGAVNVRAEQFEANKKRADLKKADEAEVSRLEARQRAIKLDKQKKLKTISDTCGIKDLAFDDDGNFVYQGCQAGMLSTSQIMQLSSELSALYPEGMGIELLDRGESLGKSIFEFVERAKAEKKTILATIVGERPAKVPPQIGVFVVTEGKAEEAPAE